VKFWKRNSISQNRHLNGNASNGKSTTKGNRIGAKEDQICKADKGTPKKGTNTLAALSTVVDQGSHRGTKRMSGRTKEKRRREDDNWTAVRDSSADIPSR